MIFCDNLGVFVLSKPAENFHVLNSIMKHLLSVGVVSRSAYVNEHKYTQYIYFAEEEITIILQIMHEICGGEIAPLFSSLPKIRAPMLFLLEIKF